MEIRILLLFFLLTILTADVIAFPKRGGSKGGGSRGGGSRGGGSKGGSSGGSSSGGSSSGGSPSHSGSNFGHESSSSGHNIGFGHGSSSSGHNIGFGHGSSSSGHNIGFGHGSSSSEHNIGFSSTETLSSQTDASLHHWNKDTSISTSLDERGGATRPYWFHTPTRTRSSGEVLEPYGTLDWFHTPTKTRSSDEVLEPYGFKDWFHTPTKTRSSNEVLEPYGFKDWLHSPSKTHSSNELSDLYGFKVPDWFPPPTKARPFSEQLGLYGITDTYPGSEVGKSDFTTENKQKAVSYKPSAPSIDHSSKANVVSSHRHVPASSDQRNPSYGTQNSSWSNSHFNPNQPTPNNGFKDRPNTMPDSSYTPVSPYPLRTSYPIPGSNQHSPPYPIHPSGHSINQSYPPYNLHFVPSQTIGHPSSYPAHIPSPVPGTFGNPYSTHPVGGTYGPTGHSYPQQHIMAKSAAQPYIPGQTVIMAPGQQDSGRGFGQMVKEALVFSTVNADVKRLINPYPHYVSNSRSADTSSIPSETHVTYNDNYYYPPGNPPSASTSSNVPQGNVPVTHPAITPDVSIPTVVGNNSSITSPTSNGSSVNTDYQYGMINNMGDSSNGFSAGNSTAGTVNDQTGPDQGTTVYSPQYKISDNDLWTLTEELFAKQDFNVFKYLTLHLQSKAENVTDAALGPLIYVDPVLYDYPTISVIRALYDNYEHNSSVKENRTLEKRKKEDLLLNVFLNTNILIRAMQWLSDRGFIDSDDFEKKDTLRNIWFSQFNGATSGFERVFTSEKYGEDLLGVQDWLYFNYQESKGRIDYMGYVDSLKLNDRASLLKLNFKMDDIIRPNATIFVGTLPELEMSLYTICFYARPNDLCPVSLGGTKFNIFTHSFRYYGRDLIDLALPIF